MANWPPRSVDDASLCCLHCVEVFTHKKQLRQHNREYHAVRLWDVDRKSRQRSISFIVSALVWKIKLKTKKKSAPRSDILHRAERQEICTSENLTCIDGSISITDLFPCFLSSLSSYVLLYIFHTYSMVITCKFYSPCLHYALHLWAFLTLFLVSFFYSFIYYRIYFSRICIKSTDANLRGTFATSVANILRIPTRWSITRRLYT